MVRLRHYFVTGLLVALPVFITFYFLLLIFRFIDGIFGRMINGYLMRNFDFFIPGAGIIFGLLLVLGCGFLASHFLGKKILPTIEKWILRFPGSRQIYPSAKQIVGFLFSKDKTAFKKVVLVEYPSKGLWSVGFVTNDGFREAQEKAREELVHIFVPSTPGPWSGFLVLIPRKDVRFLDIPVEDGIKLIVSGGILKPS